MTNPQMEMHREIGWMRPADPYILRFMDTSGAELKPASIALNVPYSANWVGQRCRKLSKHGLLERDEEHSSYSITDLGRRVAREELSSDEVEELASLE